MTNVHQLNGHKRDTLFETVAEVCGIDIGQLTKSARGCLNRACQELRPIDPPDAEIRRRAVAYTEKFPGATLTPTALAKHWPQLQNSSPDPMDGVL